MRLLLNGLQTAGSFAITTQYPLEGIGNGSSLRDLFWFPSERVPCKAARSIENSLLLAYSSICSEKSPSRAKKVWRKRHGSFNRDLHCNSSLAFFVHS
ncbi:hypothetical protein GJ744_003021 [Endocarpon pusillum]|uniref:Uncharacterized protein n=1 Tax=Endocarpon pusillum TaxID=364733 RepID=A0A8H7AB65_9EURO|nr:hypothetical protein GJ744_003021 [Endocarpon pusillum]